MSDSHCIQIKIKSGVLELSAVVTSDVLYLDATVIHGTVGEASEDILVGERSRILKFSTHHQDQSMESSSNERERGVHLHTLVDRERKRSRERG